MRFEPLKSILGLLILAISLGNSVQGATTILYDGTGGLRLDQGVGIQDWFFLADNGTGVFPGPFPPPAATSNTWSLNTTVLNTSSIAADRGGFARGPLPLNPLPLTLDRSTGYQINFSVLVPFEDHTADPNRAGFSLIALSSDLQGIELGFWTNRIAAQNTGFTFGESAAFDTSSGQPKSYYLQVLGNTYSLFAPDFSPTIPLLNGSLRNYSSSTPELVAYTIPNFLFLGDNTTSAAAISQILAVSVTAPIIPEPSSYLVVIGMLLVAYRCRKSYTAL